jgi:ABC-type transport system substrate-binding protein
VRIRQALSMAIDRQTIVDRVLNGLGAPATDVIAPFVTGSRDDACQYCEYNPEEAKRLFDEAGGLPTTRCTCGSTTTAVTRRSCRPSPRAEERPGRRLRARVAAVHAVLGDARPGWLRRSVPARVAPDYPSPENYLDPIYGEGSSNYGQWSGPAHDEFLQLVAEADSAPSIEEGIPTYQEAADVVLEELPVIPYVLRETSIVYADNLDNVSTTRCGRSCSAR